MRALIACLVALATTAGDAVAQLPTDLFPPLDSRSWEPVW
jgi:hypothetical protein